MKKFLISSIFFTGLLISNLSTAHVVFTDQLALAGSYYKGTLRVGHGCGDESTIAITVKIPAGFEGAKPQPKFGWKLSTKKELLVKPYNSHGKTITEDVVEIRWEATSKDFYLPNEQFDEFSFFTHLPNQPGPVWVNIKQECVKGVNNWADVPTSGTSIKGIKNPAALLELLPSSELHNH